MRIFEKILNCVKQNGLLAGNIGGALIGLIFGLILKSADPGDVVKTLVAYPGEIVIRGLQLLILPVVFCSLVVGSASLNVKLNGKIAIRTFSYFLITSLFNAMLGVTLAVLIHPGDASTKSTLGSLTSSTIEDRKNTLLDNFLDLGRNLAPNNIFAAFLEQTTTVYQKTSDDTDEFVKVLVPRRGWNPLGVICYALVFGSVMSLIEQKTKALLDVMKAIDEVNFKMITILIWSTPVGVASLMCSKVLEVQNMGTLMASLLSFVLTVAIGLAIYQLIVMQLIYFLIIRKNPFPFYMGVLPAAITGFAVDSSSVAMPVTLKCLDENVKVDPRVSRFVVPIGVTANMDGTALFISISSIFIAQINSIDLSFGDYINICVTATAVSIAATGAPSSSLTLIFIVLNAINAPLHDVGLLLAIDWFVDRMRTTNNVLGDCYAAAVVEHWSEKELANMQSPQKEETPDEIILQKINDISL